MFSLERPRRASRARVSRSQSLVCCTVSAPCAVHFQLRAVLARHASVNERKRRAYSGLKNVTNLCALLPIPPLPLVDTATSNTHLLSSRLLNDSSTDIFTISTASPMTMLPHLASVPPLRRAPVMAYCCFPSRSRLLSPFQFCSDIFPPGEPAAVSSSASQNRRSVFHCCQPCCCPDMNPQNTPAPRAATARVKAMEKKIKKVHTFE